jgi:tetratricopeptide (TPR) repeat protein
MRPGTRATLLATLLALATLAVFGGVTQNGFVSLDDDIYLLNNPRMQGEISFDTLTWAFTTFDASNWHPLTWLSHVFDSRLFGMQPAGHHLASVLLHAAGAALLFLVLRRMTGALGSSAFVAAVFALHPLRVESVAWASERKDVLSGLFWMLGLLAYLRYLRRPGAARYLVLVAVFALGLLSKPTVVTFPFVLLLLDVWPFGRLTAREASGPGAAAPMRTMARVVVEKIPLLGLSAAASVVTYLAQRGGAAVGFEESYHAGARFTNALVAYFWYLKKFFCPLDLAVYYPMSMKAIPRGTIIAVATLLAVLCWLVLAQRRSRPYLALGWLWFLGTLVPTIGVVKAGGQSTADRYSYLPLIGITLAVTWLAVDVVRRPRLRAAAAALTILLCAALTLRQIGYWKDSATLWGHAVRVTGKNWVALNSRAVELMRTGNEAEALADLREAESYYPDPMILVNLGLLYERRGNLGEAGRRYSQAVAAGQAPAGAHYGLGNVLASQERLEEAAREYREAVRLLPTHSEAWNNLAVVLTRLGKPEEARRCYEEAIRANPGNIQARNNYGVDLFRRGFVDEAIVEYREALRLKPDNIFSALNLADALVVRGRREEARQWYREALRLDPGSARARAGLAAGP